MANLLTRVPKRAQPGVANGAHHLPATVSRRGPRPTRPSGGTTPGVFPQVAELLAGAAPDILAFTAFPVAHWQSCGPIPAGTAEPGDKAPAIFPNVDMLAKSRARRPHHLPNDSLDASQRSTSKGMHLSTDVDTDHREHSRSLHHRGGRTLGGWENNLRQDVGQFERFHGRSI